MYLYRHDEADDRWVNTNLPVPDPAGQEAVAQVTYLKSVADQVRQLEALSGRPGRVHVYDTNSLMHYQPPEAIGWPAVVKGRVVRLVVPLVVVDVRDRKQHEGSKEMAQPPGGPCARWAGCLTVHSLVRPRRCPAARA
ncbi:hypothetical protein [Streptomyces sp. NBC_00878]|uniref:hypothetical protein n=1 Tax=Streptomyces sp. NBC_00878 TaxID=2975854 RepID=UPI002250272B|nr:hypothetical protein [Streptomyces sp. NBC_00878]MCX4910577.1 hypothetical protein [Streptomyces sp. NBC_00878]